MFCVSVNWCNSLSKNPYLICFITKCLHTKLINSHWPHREAAIISKFLIFTIIFEVDVTSTSWKIALMWMPQNPSDDKQTLVELMAYFHQATNHYLHNCWPRSMSPYSTTRPLWINVHEIYMSLNDNKLPKWMWGTQYLTMATQNQDLE